MSEKQRDLLIRYAGITIFGLVFAIVYITTKNTGELSPAERYRLYSDGFAIPGILILGYGLLGWVYNTGALDGPMYGLTSAFRALIPGGRLRVENYSDYVEKKQAKRKEHHWHQPIVGALFVAVSLIFMLLYQKSL